MQRQDDRANEYAPGPAGPAEPSGERVIDRQGAALQALARHLVHERDVDDVVQETWLAALHEGLDKALARPQWLRGVLRRQALTSHRGEGRRRAREQAVARLEEEDSLDVNELDAQHVRARLAHHIGHTSRSRARSRAPALPRRTECCGRRRAPRPATRHRQGATAASVGALADSPRCRARRCA